MADHLTQTNETFKLQLSELSCSYQGKKILDSLSLTVKNNEILCLLGPSGCGKTTALKAMAGLMSSDGGQIYIDGTLVNGQGINGKGLFIPPERRNIGMIFQDYALFPHLSVAANVGFGIRKLAKAVLDQKVEQMLSLVKLEGLGDRYPHQLSGGQQQRVAIARALAYSPKLLLLDEPFSNIDTQVRFTMIEEIREILKAQKMSAVFVTHSKEEGFAFADQMAVMNQGKIAQQDTPQVLFNHPNSPFVAEFLGKGIYLPAKVISPSTVESSLGCINTTSSESLTVGNSGELFIRPQYFQLSQSQPTNATILHKTFIGSGFNYQVQFEQLLIDVFSAQNLSIAENVGLSVIPHHLHLFLAA